jgi:hypothetical protein
MVSMFLGYGCDGETDGTGGAGGQVTSPEPLPPLSRAPLTTEERLVPAHAVEPSTLDPRQPDQMEQLLEAGFGDHAPAPGEPVVGRMLDGSSAPAPGPSPTLLLRFVHLADTQLADDESPARIVNIDAPAGAATSSAFRPHEGHECRILNAAVRTMNRIHQDLPIGMVVLGGDNADTARVTGRSPAGRHASATSSRTSAASRSPARSSARCSAARRTSSCTSPVTRTSTS